MWLGEQITERGIGNGMSLIIFAGIVVDLPHGGAGDARAAAHGADGAAPLILLLLVLMVVVIGGDRLRRARPPAGHGAVREARGRAADVRRVEHAHPAQGEHRRRHPGHLRLVDPGVPGDDRADVRRRSSWLRGAARSDRAGACRCTTCSTSPASSSSATSTRRSSSTRMTSRRTCGSTAGSSRASGRASGRRSTSTRS